ncbi:hypothetical protein A7982_13226 [Minicystis rosea]|nr:hypothetical protein A7982_13226 [Minicystis rosea]
MPKLHTPKTLFNTVIAPWSWPCVLVFVSDWVEPTDFGSSPENAIPSALYLPDGRVVPTCVIQVKPSKGPPARGRRMFPRNLLGGGFLVSSEVQGREQIGSVGCLVTDGHTTYALTNRHVAGDAGQQIYSYVGGRRVPIGVSDERQIGKVPFERVYPTWPGKQVFSNLDIGLVRVDDVNDWTAQVFGLGPLGTPLDLHVSNISVDLVDKRVRAFGGASGPLEGRIRGLFYRYKSVGGFDYVADLLIAPDVRAEDAFTHHGDSGTLWCMEVTDSEPGSHAITYGALTHSESLVTRASQQRAADAKVLRPLAVEWGAHELGAAVGGTTAPFALATFLSTATRELDLDLIGDWQTGLPEYWGELGHFAIGREPWSLVGDPTLKALMKLNAENIGFSESTLRSGELYKRRSQHFDFVPLADVADDVWRGLDARHDDGANHFADMDEPGKGPFEGKTLLDLCVDPAWVVPSRWNDFYDALGIEDEHKGSLPFRVWQIYDEMVAYAAAGEIDEFVASAGILCHYIGDACQPLHVSRLHHGYPPVKKGRVAYKVHAVYETIMLDEHADEVVRMLDREIANREPDSELLKGGHNAAIRTVALMRNTVEQLPPKDIIDTYSAGRNEDERAKELWEAFGTRTVQLMADSAALLALLWESAWVEGKGKVDTKDLAAIDEGTLQSLYLQSGFLRSRTLSDMIGELETRRRPARRTGSRLRPPPPTP